MKYNNNGWTFEEPKGMSRNGRYYKNDWCVWSTGFEWKIKRPDGFVYATTYQTLAKAQAFAERKMK